MVSAVCCCFLLFLCILTACVFVLCPGRVFLLDERLQDGRCAFHSTLTVVRRVGVVADCTVCFMFVVLCLVCVFAVYAIVLAVNQSPAC